MQADQDNARDSEAIAIIGMDGRFPGAADIDAYWQNLLEGRETLDRFADADLDPSVPQSLRTQRDYVRVRGLMPEADRFDAEFFGIAPREAEMLDPQQRTFLEMCWRALEDAGYAAGTHDALTGVFAGMSYNTYFAAHVAQHPALLASFGEIPAMVANEKDYLATRVAYKLDLRGPCVTVSTACSTSLVAVCHAFNSLLDYQCDIALAGGVSVICPPQRGYLYQEGSIHSPDGRCRPFDAGAKGTVFSSGGGVVVLKRLSDALADNDTIHAVIRGAAMNNDGAGKVSFTAPGVQGQAEVVQMAQEVAGVDAGDIGYIEAHGTGTSLGDPVEIAALTRAFRTHTNRRGYCGIGSVKGNIGHLDAASGIAGLIKATLALREGRIPATLHFTSPNPELHLAESPFHVIDRVREWPADAPRFAGVSSFGLGGTNAHVVLEAPPPVAKREEGGQPQLIVLSAKTDAALERARTALAEFLETKPVHSFQDIAWTLQRGRQAFAKRLAVAAGSRAEAAALLKGNSGARMRTGNAKERPRVVFLFPGQGSQRPGMCEPLYRAEPLVRDIIDRCADALADDLDFDLREIMFGSTDNATELLDETRYTQPALFAAEYAIARLWMQRGVRPDALVGHSIGEFVAATLAGIFRIEDAVRLVAERARLMQEQPPGSMLSVRAAEDAVREHLADDVAIAALNAPGFCVLSGDDAAIARTKSRLEKAGLACSTLRTSHAFHSAMMDPVAAAFETTVGKLALSPPAIDIVSTVTGAPLDAAQATDPAYWSRQLREPVRFMQALQSARGESREHVVFVECGPGTAASTFAAQTFADDADVQVIASLGRHREGSDERVAMLDAAGRLWTNGVSIDWTALHDNARRRVPAPTYRFERTRHWLDSRPASDVPLTTASRTDASPGPASPQSAPQVARVDERPMIEQLGELLADVSGLETGPAMHAVPFAQLGLDSLFLTQFSQALKKRFGLDLRFRQLLVEHNTLAAIAALLDEEISRNASASTPRAVTDARSAPAQELSAAGKDYVRDVVRRHAWRTSGSRAFARTHRAHLAGIAPAPGDAMLADIAYPIVIESSSGSRIQDIDGNGYIDLVNAHGAILLGHANPAINDAVRQQMKRGAEAGLQTPLAGRVARLVQALTGFERVSFHATGTEALHAAIDAARTVTQRRKVVTFADESARIWGHGEADDGIEVLDYGSERALQRVRELRETLAAVLVEPVQSLHPERYAPDFIAALRAATRECGALLVFDEIACGFRVHPAGAPGICGTRADLSCYGATVGGGMPLGVLAGDANAMCSADASSGSQHSLALAAAEATLAQLRESGPSLQRTLNERTARLACELEQHAKAVNAPVDIRSFSSWFFIDVDARLPCRGLLEARLRAGGVHVIEGEPCFLTTAHSDADLAQVSKVFQEALAEMHAAGFFPDAAQAVAQEKPAKARTPAGATMGAPPAPGARLGRRPDGQPGWFVPDPDRPGRYRELGVGESRAN